jgi:crotonobetaine/carnitine-CoA ligase
MSSFPQPSDTLPYALDALVQASADTVMLVDAETDERVTRGEFDQQNRLWARRLAALGVDAGDIIGTMMGPSFDAYNAWLGVSGLGAVEVPINPQLRGRSLTYLLNHAQPEIVIIHNAYLEQLAGVADTLETLRTVIVPDLGDDELPSVDLPFTIVTAAQFRSQEVEVEYRLSKRHDTACIIYTSGTTGPPKGVIVPWGWMTTRNQVPARITGGSRYSTLSPAHMSGKGALNHVVADGRALVLRKAFSVSEFWNDIVTYDCRVMQLFPAHIKYLLAATPPTASDRDVPLKFIWSAPLIPETKEFMDRFDITVSTGFGSTETGGPLAGVEIDGTNLRSCGKVNPDPRGYEVRLVDEFDEEVAPGEVGEMIVRASCPWTLNVGYYRNPEATAEAWRNGWFHTGDAMTRDEDGNFYFVDRIKDCIRHKGENISSFELEAYALSYPGVAEAAAVGVPDPLGEQEVKIFVVPEPETELDLAAMGYWLAEQMPKFMVPRYLEVVQDLPKTPATGRIQKSLLRTHAAGAYQWDRAKSSHPGNAREEPASASQSPLNSIPLK